MRAIQPTETLVYYDGVEVFAGQDSIGGHYVGMIIDTLDAVDRYLVTGVSPERLGEFRSGVLDLRTLFLEAPGGEWYITRADGESGQPLVLEPQAGSLLATDFLPEEGFLLDTGPADDSSLGQSEESEDINVEFSSNSRVQGPEAGELVESELATENLTSQLSNPFSTGGGGPHFEAHIQAMFVVLMLTGGCAPGLPTWPIKEIKLQTKVDGYNTDDVMVVVEDPVSKRKRRLIAQIKHSVNITEGDSIFRAVIQAAWSDFNNGERFVSDEDTIALITGPLRGTDTEDVAWLLGQARSTNGQEEFFRKVIETRFSSASKRRKLAAFQAQLDISEERLYSFLRSLHLLCYDLGSETGTTLPLLFSHISQFEIDSPKWIWGRIVDWVQTLNQAAGTITPESIPEDLRDAFIRKEPEVIPDGLVASQTSQVELDRNQYASASILAKANLLGAWDEKRAADLEIVHKLTAR